MKRIITYTVLMIFLTSCSNNEEQSKSIKKEKSNQEQSKEDNQNTLKIASFNISEDGSKITIGDQIWSTNNLTVTQFRNGDPIPIVSSEEEWINACKNEEPAMCYYNNDQKNLEIYGALYNWYAVNDPRQLSPEGWKIPSNDEWQLLINNVGGYKNAAPYLMSKNKWGNTKNVESAIGFNAVPGGSRNVYIKLKDVPKSGSFSSIGQIGVWWSSTEATELGSNYILLTKGKSKITTSVDSKCGGMSVRCIKE